VWSNLHQPLVVSFRYWPSECVALLLLRLRAIITPSTAAHTSASPASAAMYGLSPAGRIPVSDDVVVLEPAATGCGTAALPPGDVDVDVDCETLPEVCVG
jgi:hypothetical protein